MKRLLGASRGSESGRAPARGGTELFFPRPAPAVPPSKPVAHVPTSATIGSKAVLRCTETDGSPPPTFRWYRDTMLMPSDPKTSLTFRNSSYTLDSTTGELVSAGRSGRGDPQPPQPRSRSSPLPSRPSSPSAASTPVTTTARPRTTWAPPRNQTSCTWKPVRSRGGGRGGVGLLQAPLGCVWHESCSGENCLVACQPATLQPAGFKGMLISCTVNDPAVWSPAAWVETSP